MNPDPNIEKMAVLIVVNCFRNTVLENYHAEWPQFTDEKMKALMKEAVDRTYTALCGLLNLATTADFAAMQDSLAWYTPRWDRPQFDPNMLKNMEHAKTLKGKLPGSDQYSRLPSWEDTPSEKTTPASCTQLPENSPNTAQHPPKIDPKTCV